MISGYFHTKFQLGLNFRKLGVLENQKDNTNVHKHTKIARYKPKAINTHESFNKLQEFHTVQVSRTLSHKENIGWSMKYKV